MPEAGQEQPDNIAPVYNPDDWALVVYQPPASQLQIQPFMEDSTVLEVVSDVCAAKVVFGPELTPEMIFIRNFEAILHSEICFEIPKPIQVLPLQSVLLSKRSWDLAFEVPSLPYYNTALEHRHVARALFPVQQIESSPIGEAE